MKAINRKAPLEINCWILHGAHSKYGSGHPGATANPDKLDIRMNIPVATELDGWKIAKRLLAFAEYQDYVFWVEPFFIGFTTAEDWLDNTGYGYDEKTDNYKAKRHIGHTSENTEDGDPDPDSFMAGRDFVDPRHGGQGKKLPGVATRWAFQKEWNTTGAYTGFRETVEDFYEKNPTAEHPSWVHPEWEYPFDDNDPNRPW